MLLCYVNKLIHTVIEYIKDGRVPNTFEIVLLLYIVTETPKVNG